MGFRKFSPLLVLSILVLCQAGNLQAAPFRSAIESSPDPTALSEEEARLLLAALVKDFVLMKAREQELELEQETEGPSTDSPRSKRCSRLSTCVLGTYQQHLNKLHLFSGTDFGAEWSGKKREVASNFEKEGSFYFGPSQDAH